MNITRKRERVTRREGAVWYHCPKCGKYTWHSIDTNLNCETLTCRNKNCGNVLWFKR